MARRRSSRRRGGARVFRSRGRRSRKTGAGMGGVIPYAVYGFARDKINTFARGLNIPVISGLGDEVALFGIAWAAKRLLRFNPMGLADKAMQIEAYNVGARFASGGFGTITGSNNNTVIAI